MTEENEMIKNVLVEAGVFSWALTQVGGSEAELFRMFRDDFESLVTLCQS